jgi:DNA mismatch repair ATPase MutS
VEAFVAMADACIAHDMVIPEVVDRPTALDAEGLGNIFVAEPVPVDVQLGGPRHMLFLTGPNMAGKSTLLRSLGAALYLAHLGMGVPAKRFRFAPCQDLVTALDVSDDIHAGVSFFRAEALRMKAIGEAMKSGRSVIALVDEPFKGTNVQDAMDASWLVLQAFTRANNSLFAISSHLIELGDTLLATDRVVCRHFAAADSEEGLVFDFCIRDGVSTQRLGMRVLEQEGLISVLGESD